ncbi:MAG: hypothetical protein KL863_15445 [Rhizobium sp.]|nr:hypothetical protein [Rhizobium sp.]
MPRYYFNIRSSQGLIEDPDGTDLPDLDTARAEARQSARDLLASLLQAGEEVDGQVFEIADGDGRVLDRLPFRSVVRFR